MLAHHARLALAILVMVLPTGCGGEEAELGRQTQGSLLGFQPSGSFPTENAPPTPTFTTLDMVRHHSPVIYQDTHRNTSDYNVGREYVRDYITKINFADSYNLRDNYKLAASYPMTPHVYYSLSATPTHFFIGYYFYHINVSSPYASNDFSGLMLAVARKGASYGSGVCQDQHGCLVAMITRARPHFMQYNDLTHGYLLENGSESIDGPISTVPQFSADGAPGRHPRVYISASTHKIYSCEHLSEASCGSGHDDGIIYYLRQDGAPSAAPDPSTGGAGSYTKRYAYGLIALDSSTNDRGPWALRNYRNDSPTSSCGPTDSCTFRSWGVFNAANTGSLSPWTWDDPDDGPTFSGDFLCDPVKLFDVQLDGAPFEGNRLSHKYLSHAYWTHRVKLSRIRPDTSFCSYRLYFEVTSSNQMKGTDKVFDAHHWRNRTFPLVDNYPSYGGGTDPIDDDITYGDSSNEHYFCRSSRQAGADTAIRIRGRSDGKQIWYYGAWMGTPGTKIKKTDHHTCQSYGCAWVDFEMESNPQNNYLHLL